MEREIEQLMEMGATRAQARTALRKSKDVMDAAEKIFSGEYDNVAQGSDGEIEIEVEEVKPVKRAARPHTPEEDETEEEEGGEDEGGEDDEDMEFYGEDEDDSIFDHTTKRTGAEIDPYAGIFFSKDRREEVIEVEQDRQYAELPGYTEPFPLMSQDEWMKGCPETGEQQQLFGLWNDLQKETIPCPYRCGGEIQRQKGLFFSVWRDFQLYINYLRNNVQKACPSCSQCICLACSQPVTPARLNKSQTDAPPDPLFHCADLQGVILGIGLSMVESMFEEQVKASELESTEHIHEDDAEGGSRKKRKLEQISKSVSPSASTTDGDSSPGDDEEKEYLFGLSSFIPGGSGRKGKKSPGGTGYSGPSGKEDQSGVKAAQESQQRRDAEMGTLLAQVRNFVPSLKRKPHSETSDYLPHPTALVHLRRRFNAVSSALLRNDSLADMSERTVLYFELLEWLETVSGHEALASMMGMPIMVPTSIKPMPPRKSASRSTFRERVVVYEGSSGPRELLEAIVIQAKAALKGLDSTSKKEDPKAEMTEEEKRKTSFSISSVKGKGKEREMGEEMKLFQFCNRILATVTAIDKSLLDTKGAEFLKRLHDALPKVHTASGSEQVFIAAGSSEEQRRKIYEDWAQRVKFEYCDLTIPPSDPDLQATDMSPAFKSVYSSEARSLASADLPKRSLAIAKELAVLTTNLPFNYNSSIFLRVDETRVDVIKALITGPEGTPYENGCFLFDIFLGSNYNINPPSVKYTTTNDGKYRFNPNLYADGKVCLSLLGTWQGPGWVSGKSTLLQVLISIQSMILCEEPYLNEPGWENGRGTAASVHYSANVRRMVVATAMIGNLQNPPEPWADVIRTHFRLKARAITAQLDRWLKEDDGHAIAGDGAGRVPEKNESKKGSSNSPMGKLVAELKPLLATLEAQIGSH